MAENDEWTAQHLFAGAVRALIVVVLLAAALSPAQASPADAQRALPPHAPIVELFTIGEQAFAVVVRPESTRVVPLSTSVRAISHSAETLRRALVHHEMARDAAATLYDLIFRPVRDQLDGVTTLTVVPHGEMIDIPFPMLFDRERSRYLIQDMAIVIAPSLSLAIESERCRYAGPAAVRAAGAIAAQSKCVPAYGRDSLTAGEIARLQLDKLRHVKRALAPHAAIVELFTIGERAFAIVIRPESTRLVTLLASVTAMSYTAAILRSAEGERFRGAAATLYDLVFKGIRDHLEGVTTLAVVPHRELSGIPFGALFDRERDRYLIEDMAVVHARSASATVAWSRRVQEASAPTLLSIGASEFDRRRYPGAEDLPGALREAEAVAAQSKCVQLLSGSDATALAVQRELAESAVIHYAGHILKSGGESRLLLAPGHGRDSLTAGEIAQLRLDKARVAVLAACRAFPQVSDAFLAAGVPSVIASASDVEDAAAPRTMRRLHRFLRDGDDAAEALRKTALFELGEGRIAPLSIRLLVVGGSRTLVR